jgi:hypothetical protein
MFGVNLHCVDEAVKQIDRDGSARPKQIVEAPHDGQVGSAGIDFESDPRLTLSTAVVPSRGRRPCHQ